MNPKLLTFALFGVLAAFSAQAQLAMGKWQTHFAYNSIEKIAQSENKVFAISDGSMFSVNKNDESIECYSKITGLNDGRIANIAYDTETAQLLIVYANGNMDVMTKNGIINIPDFYLKQMTASKNVNDIMFYKRRAYLSTDFGILVVNLEKYEISDTYYLADGAAEVKVLNTAVFRDYIYAATPTALYRAQASNPMLANFANWQTMQDVPNGTDIRKIVAFGNYLVLHSGGMLANFNFSENYWELFQAYVACDEILSAGERLIFKNNSNSGIYCFDLNKNFSEIIIKNENAERFYPAINSGSYDAASKRFWLGSSEDGVLAVSDGGAASVTETYKPNSPASNYAWNIAFAGKKMITVPGGAWAAYYERKGDISILENNKWNIIPAKEIEKHTGKRVLDLMTVAIDPKDDSHFFITSYGTGLYEFKNNLFDKRYAVSNSPLQNADENIDNSVYTWGLQYDREGNLFVTNSFTENGVKILRSNGKWTEYITPNRPTWGKFLISDRNVNQKWVISQRNPPGVYVYDDNGTLDNTTDDKYKFFSSFINTEPDKPEPISPQNYYCMTQDKNGVIWVGTESGPLLLSNTENAFDANYTCSRVKIPRNDGTDHADFLLDKERIRSIAIDGANRKWIGTEYSGVYLLSENGQETLKHFTTKNSPLLSDYIISITINPVTGEVFFGSTSGLVSYQSDAVESGETFNNVHAYPNPVRPDFRGTITITGLVRDTRVKITDINGNLIYETQSNGGFATWDGKNLYGERVATGIYLAICITEDGSQNAITKIMVIN